MANSLPMRTKRDYARTVAPIADHTKEEWTDYAPENGTLIFDLPSGGDIWESFSQALINNDYLSSSDSRNYYIDSVKIASGTNVSTTNLIASSHTVPIKDNYTSGTLAYEVYTVTNSTGIAFDTPPSVVRNVSIHIDFRDVYTEYGGSPETTLYQTIVFSGLKIDLPKSATVTGAKIEVLDANRIYYAGPGINYNRAELRGLYAALKFTYDGVVGGTDEDLGYVRMNQQPFAPVSQDKTYQYNVYKNGDFLGEWGADVISEPVVTNQVNTLPGDFNVQLMRDLETGKQEFEEIAITGYATDPDNDGEEGTDDDLMLTNTQEPILASVNVERAIGDGTDVAVNNDVEVKEYYGGFESLLTSDGEELLTSDLEPLQIENGYPFGRYMYKGFISKYKIGYTADGAVTEIKVLNHADEHNNIMFQSSDTKQLYVPFYVQDQYDYYELYSQGAYRYMTLPTQYGQTFSVTGVTDLSAISLFLNRTGYHTDSPSEYPTLVMNVYTGTPSSPGTLMGTATASVPSLDDFSEVFFNFTGVTLAASTGYCFVLKHTSEGQNKVNIRRNIQNPYSGGAAYQYNQPPWISA